MQTHDTRDETLRRKSSGGITDGLNWLKRHHNFSFFHQIFLYIFLHNLLSFFFVMFLHLNVVWWHDLYAKIFLTPKTRGDYAVFMSDSQNTGQTTAAASLGTIVV